MPLICFISKKTGWKSHTFFFQYIKDGTFDPIYVASYWIRFVLGLLSGTILAIIIPIESIGHDDATTVLKGFGPTVLALLGGFSATVVYRILNRLITAVESLFRGETRSLVQAQEHAAKTRFAEQSVQDRLQLSGRLTKLQQQLSSSQDPAAIQRELQRVQNELIAPGGLVAEEVQPLIPDSTDRKEKA